MLDNSFSTDGLVSTDVGAATFDQGRPVAIQDDGRIVVVGTTGYSKALDFGAARYLPDGTPDPEFSFNGVDLTSVVFGDDHATCVVIQPDGKILIGGYGFCTEGNCFAMVRYLSDGTPDPDFGADGIVTTEISGGYVLESKAIALQDDGKILLAGGGNTGLRRGALFRRRNGRHGLRNRWPCHLRVQRGERPCQRDRGAARWEDHPKRLCFRSGE